MKKTIIFLAFLLSALVSDAQVLELKKEDIRKMTDFQKEFEENGFDVLHVKNKLGDIIYLFEKGDSVMYQAKIFVASPTVLIYLIGKYNKSFKVAGNALWEEETNDRPILHELIAYKREYIFVSKWK